MRRFLVLAIALVAPAVGLTGCGGTTTSVSGKVTYQGKLVVWGNVSLVGVDGIVYAADIRDDGTFTFPKVPVGSCKLGVSSPNPDGDSATKLLEKGSKKGLTVKGGSPTAERVKPPPGSWFALPDRYRDPVNSGLAGEIKKGEPLNIDLN